MWYACDGEKGPPHQCAVAPSRRRCPFPPQRRLLHAQGHEHSENTDKQRPIFAGLRGQAAPRVGRGKRARGGGVCQAGEHSGKEQGQWSPDRGWLRVGAHSPSLCAPSTLASLFSCPVLLRVKSRRHVLRDRVGWHRWLWMRAVRTLALEARANMGCALSCAALTCPLVLA